MPATLFAIHGSHPCAAVRRALEIKGVAHRTVELLPPLHPPIQRALFGARTVPAIRWESGERLSGSRAIMRRLDELVPEPALLPADPQARTEVLRAEEWGDQVYQPIARRLLWRTFALCPEAMVSYRNRSRLTLIPDAALRAVAPAAAAVACRVNGAGDGAVRADLRALPRHLDRVDGWLEQGVIGGDEVNAADLQIASTSRLLLTIGDLRPFFAHRPAQEHARRLFGEWDGATPPSVFPGVWLDEPQSAV
jgi:glutathione S-transferase